LGRALYHLGQRRGFKSNRREGRKATLEGASAKKAKEERSKVLAAIEALDKEIPASGARTLGEYLSRMNPVQRGSVRRRWTARPMFESEFEAIWSNQARFHEQVLTPELKQRIRRLLFDQRPIQAGKPGLCELEPGCPRVPMHTSAAQRFRLLQKANDLELVDAQGQAGIKMEHRRKLIVHLEAHGDLTFSQVRALLGLPKNTRFNLQAGGDKKLPGNRTASVMQRAFGKAWHAMSELEQKRTVRQWANEENPEHLHAVATNEWGLSSEAATVLAQSEPEDGYCALSLRALSKLLPRMERGDRFKEAERQEYGNRFSGRPPKDRLPPVEEVLTRIPNPAVLRTLTEVRKLVNAIIPQYGKPAQVRIELARDLKRSAKDRQALLDSMSKNRRLRADAAKRILEETGNARPSRDDVNKVLLFDEFKGCAYCGKTISFAELFNGQVEVDHVLPLSRFPDSSLGNLALACGP
jgi:CRISPR-associated endonuclease Csn1